MEFSIIFTLLVFVGIIYCPIVTLSCVLFATGHPILAIIALFVSLVRRIIIRNAKTQTV